MWLCTVILLILLDDCTGASKQTRIFKKVALPTATDLQNFVFSASQYSIQQCSKLCVDHSGCKSFSLTIIGGCRLYANAFTPGTNSATDVAYYIRRGEDFSCVKDIGFEYYGYLSMTSSNKNCLKWDSVPTAYPNSSFIDGSAEKAENFCREPTLLDVRPWCYVSSTAKEYCNVGFCCLSYNTLSYVGNVSFTANGRTCQRWDSQYPHSHGYLHGSHLQNYCRATSDNPGRTWCYTTNLFVRWEYCGVKQCGY